MIFLIIVSLYGGIERIPMSSEKACATAAVQITAGKHAVAYCVPN